MSEFSQNHEQDLAPLGTNIKRVFEILEGYTTPDSEFLELHDVPTQSPDHETITVVAALENGLLRHDTRLSIIPAITGRGFKVINYYKIPGMDNWRVENDTPKDDITIKMTSTANVARRIQRLLPEPERFADNDRFTILKADNMDDSDIYQGLKDIFYDAAPEKRTTICGFTEKNVSATIIGVTAKVDEISLTRLDEGGAVQYFLEITFPDTTQEPEPKTRKNNKATPATVGKATKKVDDPVMLRISVDENGKVNANAHRLIDGENREPMRVEDVGLLANCSQLFLESLKSAKLAKSVFGDLLA